MGACILKESQNKHKHKKIKEFNEPSIVNDLQTREIEEQNYEKKTKGFVNQRSFERIQEFLDSCKDYRIETHVPKKEHNDEGSFCESVAREFEEYKNSIEIDNQNDVSSKNEKENKIEKEEQSNSKELESLQSQIIKSLISTEENSINCESKNYHFLKSYFQLKEFIVEIDYL